MQLDDLLNRRELLDSLETEPLVDYLKKHGVLDQDCCSKILSSSESYDRNRELLYSLINYQRSNESQTAPPVVNSVNQRNSTAFDCYREDLINDDLRLNLNAFGLFMNALRHTGYHRLASLLDNDRRIHKPTVGSRVSLIETFPKLNLAHYHARPRRNGQLGVVLQVGAVKVSAPEYGLDPAHSSGAGGGPVGGYWINLADFGDDEESRERSASFPDFRISLLPSTERDEDEDEEDGGCSWCCCRRRKRKKKKVASSQANGHHRGQGDGKIEKVLATKSMSDDQIIKAYRADAKRRPELSEEDQRVLQLKASILNEKSELFYKILYNADSLAHENLLKYFEQERGILVLDCSFDDAFVIVAICTERAKLTALKDDLDNGSFCRDLEACLLIPDILSAIGVKAMKLAVDFDDSEFREALLELS